MVMRLRTAVWLVAAVVATNAYGDGTGGAAGAWRFLGGGARPAAMGGAYCALSDDAAAIFYNPAGLDQTGGGRCELTYDYPYSEIAGISSATAATSYNMSGRGFALGTFAAGVEYFKASEIWEAGPQGLTGRSFSDYEMALSLAWGKGLGASVVQGEEPTYYLGTAARIISSKIYDYQDGGFGLDAGFLWRPVPSMRAGLAFANVVAPNIRLKETSDAYPATAAVGVALDMWRGAVISAEGRVRKEGDVAAATGIEAVIADTLALRAGYVYPQNVPSAGVGVKKGHYGFDFMWRPHGDLGDAYVGTAIITW